MKGQPCISCGTKGEHTGEECSARRPRCHACGEKPTCIQAIANGCKPTCLHCYFDNRIIVRVFDRADVHRIDLGKHEAEIAFLWPRDEAERAAAQGAIAGFAFRRAEMAAQQRGAL